MWGDEDPTLRWRVLGVRQGSFMPFQGEPPLITWDQGRFRASAEGPTPTTHPVLLPAWLSPYFENSFPASSLPLGPQWTQSGQRVVPPCPCVLQTSTSPPPRSPCLPLLSSFLPGLMRRLPSPLLELSWGPTWPSHAALSTDPSRRPLSPPGRVPQAPLPHPASRSHHFSLLLLLQWAPEILFRCFTITQAPRSGLHVPMTMSAFHSTLGMSPKKIPSAPAVHSLLLLPCLPPAMPTFPQSHPGLCLHPPGPCQSSPASLAQLWGAGSLSCTVFVSPPPLPQVSMGYPEQVSASGNCKLLGGRVK